jgi:hypothetical protein
MYGLTRAATTLIFAAAAGLLIWLATQISNDHIGGYWARIGLVAGAGLLMALSQLLGGWTKWGWPRLSIAVFLTGFVPVAIASLWVILGGEPSNGWFHEHVLSWSSDLHISGLVNDLLYYIPVLAFGTGLVFGFSFDTTGPILRGPEVVVDDARETAPVGRRRGLFGRRRDADARDTNGSRVVEEPVPARDQAADEGPGDRERLTTTRRTEE